MKSVRIYADDNGNSKIEDLPIPFVHLDFPLDPEMFQRLSRGDVRPDDPLPQLIGSGGVQLARSIGEKFCDWQVSPYRQLTIVVSGRVELSVSEGPSLILLPGDIFLADDLVGTGHRIRRLDDCRTVHASVAESWKPNGVMPLVDESVGRSPNRQPNLKRMYKSNDDRSYFRPFDYLFADASGIPTPSRPIRGFHFVSFPSEYFIDWHPEVVNNFVVVLSGELELEVGGVQGGKEIFCAGDICLAEDKTGEGHIDRSRGITRLALFEFADENLWKVPSE